MSNVQFVPHFDGITCLIFCYFEISPLQLNVYSIVVPHFNELFNFKLSILCVRLSTMFLYQLIQSSRLHAYITEHYIVYEISYAILVTNGV